MLKRPFLLLLSGVTLLYFPAKCVYRFVRAYNTPFWHDITDLTKIYYSLYAHPMVAFLQFFVPLVVVIGIFLLKKWGYYLLMVFSILYSARLFYSLIERIAYASKLGPYKYLLIGTIAFKMLYFLAIIFYFSRPKVRQLFK